MVADHKARQALAQYIARAPLSLQKLTYDALGGKILYHTSYNPWFNYGLYSSRCEARWQRLPHVARVAPAAWRDSHPQESLSQQPTPNQTLTVPQRSCRSAWARLIPKVYEADPLICPRCGSQMKVFAVLTDAFQVRTILPHLIKIGRAPPGLDPSSLN